MSTEEAREMIQRYREAEMAVLEGKSVIFNGQQLTLESLSQIVGTQACRDGEPQAGKTGI